MPLVQFHLKRSHEQLRSATSNLQDALRIAKSSRYTQTWLDAIAKALTDTEITCLRIGNIITCIARCDESRLPTLTEKEN